MHTFNGTKAEEPTFFALSYPFSYQDCLQKFSEFEQKFQTSTSVYYHNEVAVHSIEGRAMQLITISSFDNITTEREDLLPDLFPLHSGVDSRPFKYAISLLIKGSRISHV